MKRIAALLALSTLAACGWSEEEFSEEYLVAACDKLDECEILTEVYSYEDCLATPGPEQECEDYDSKSAEACVEATHAVSCEDFLLAQGTEICDEVCSNL